MKHPCLFLCLLLVVGLPALLPAADDFKDVEPDPRVQADRKEGWDLNQARITDPSRPRVLLIGDSILSGYNGAAIKGLAGKAHVDVWITPLCQSEYFNGKLSKVLAKGPYDVVLINLGLHGFQRDRKMPDGSLGPRIPEGQFESLTRSFVEVMRRENPKGRIIWASTTPIMAKGAPFRVDDTLNPLIVEHNRMAAKVMNEMGVPVVDFYGLLVNRMDLARGDVFHWTGKAYKIIADAAVAKTLELLPARHQGGSK
jgi:lysophospholipase L1-like esterase